MWPVYCDSWKRKAVVVNSECWHSVTSDADFTYINLVEIPGNKMGECVTYTGCLEQQKKFLQVDFFRNVFCLTVSRCGKNVIFSWRTFPELEKRPITWTLECLDAVVRVIVTLRNHCPESILNFTVKSFTALGLNTAIRLINGSTSRQ